MTRRTNYTYTGNVQSYHTAELLGSTSDTISRRRLRRRLDIDQTSTRVVLVSGISHLVCKQTQTENSERGTAFIKANKLIPRSDAQIIRFQTPVKTCNIADHRLEMFCHRQKRQALHLGEGQHLKRVGEILPVLRGF